MFNQIPSQLRRYEFKAVAPSPQKPHTPAQTVVNYAAVKHFYPHPPTVMEQCNLDRMVVPSAEQPYRLVNEGELKQIVYMPKPHRQAKRVLQSPLTVNIGGGMSTTQNVSTQPSYNRMITIVPHTSTFVPPPPSPAIEVELSPIRTINEPDQMQMQPTEGTNVIQVESQARYPQTKPILQVEAGESRKKERSPYRIPIFQLHRNPVRKPLFEMNDIKRRSITQGESTVRYGIFRQNTGQPQGRDREAQTVKRFEQDQLQLDHERQNLPADSSTKKQKNIRPKAQQAVNDNRPMKVPEKQRTPVKIFEPLPSDGWSTKALDAPRKLSTPAPISNSSQAKPRSPVEPLSLKPLYSAPTSTYIQQSKPSLKEGKSIKPTAKFDPTMIIVSALILTTLIWVFFAVGQLLSI